MGLMGRRYCAVIKCFLLSFRRFPRRSGEARPVPAPVLREET